MKKELNDKQKRSLALAFNDVAVKLEDPVLGKCITRGAVFTSHEQGPYLFVTATALLDDMQPRNVIQFLRNVSDLISAWEIQKAAEESLTLSEKDVN
jgi:hypothetical protein